MAKRSELQAVATRVGGSAIQRVELRTRAVELRKQGKSYVEIAEHLGCSAQDAYRMVSAALKELRQHCLESAEELRQIEVQRLDAMMDAIAPLAGLAARNSLDDGEGGEVALVDYIDRVLKIMERKAKLLGLDAPQRKQVEAALGIYAMDRPPESDEDARRFLHSALGSNF